MHCEAKNDIMLEGGMPLFKVVNNIHIMHFWSYFKLFVNVVFEYIGNFLKLLVK